MEFLFFLAFILPVLAASGIITHRKFLSADAKALDPVRYPTLHRVQRVIRNNNTKMRELEFDAKQAKYKLEIAKTELNVVKSIEQIKKDSQKKFLTESSSWSQEFNAIDEERRQAAIKKAMRRKTNINTARNLKLRKLANELEAERKRKVDEEIARRQQELAQWTATEIARQKMKAMDEVKPLLKKVKKEDPDEGYASRRINVHLANLRKSPTDQSKKVGLLEMGDKVTVARWAIGSTLYDNNVWFLVEGTNGTENGWIWSGALDSLSTSGIRRDYVEEQKSASQDEIDEFYHRLIDEELF